MSNAEKQSQYRLKKKIKDLEQQNEDLRTYVSVLRDYLLGEIKKPPLTGHGLFETADFQNKHYDRI
ncbi:MAG: hypothetical protein ACM3S2_04735 [Ignavibacteriales bacterium]